MAAEAAQIQFLPDSPDRWQVAMGEEYQRLYSRFSEPGRGLNEEELGRVFNTAAEILAQCPDPKGPSMRRTGLALGKVQSGKTLSYTSLTALAFDSGYRLVIVLTGRTEALGDQNRNRLHEDLELAIRATPHIARFDSPTADDEAELQTVLENGSVILITLLKTQSRIADLRSVLSAPEIGRYATLVIDDEADQASQNTRRYKNGRSSIYDHIVQLRDALPHHAYVAYTATPQANLLIETIDELSPEFCVLIEPGSGYTGGSVFFGPDSDKYVRIIPDDEANDTHVNGVPEHLKLALATFLVAGAILHLRSPQDYHSMLIHHSVSKDDHKHLYGAVQTLIDGWRQALALPDTDPGAGAVLSLARRAYEDLRQTSMSQTDWMAISAQLRAEVKAKVWLVNSLPQGKNPSSSPFNLMNNIMIGGNMLDRGVTIPGLAITYITRKAKNSQADTIEQRARWFGYKRKYLDICRIFTSQIIADTFIELLSHEDDFWESLRRNQCQGIPVKEWPRFFRLGMGLRPTRSSVARTKAFLRKEWEVQHKVTTDPVVANKNVRLVRSFFKAHPGAELRSYGTRNHRAILNCDPEEVVELLAQLSPYEGQDWDSSYIVEYLERLVLTKNLAGIDVLLMGDGEPRKRTPDYKDRDTYNPQEGKTTQYPGDRYIVDDRMHLQVHILQVHATENSPLSPETIALALYTPLDSKYSLGNIVIPSD